jgi:acetyl esterase/lipase
LFHAAKPSAPIVLYLPPGPVLPQNAEEEHHLIATLAAASAATVVRINYRASSLHQYPTPCHDVLIGYDWVREHLLVDQFNRPYLARLGVCGELIGGSLATMLALTECRVGQSRIGAAAVNNPLVDWVFPDELPVVKPEDLPEPFYGDETALPADEDMAGSLAIQEATRNVLESERKSRKRPSSKAQALTSWQAHGDNTVIPALTLSGERDVLFNRPDDYFDRFASPIHFFRSPHAQLVYPQPDHIYASQQPDELVDMEIQMTLNHYATFDENAKVPPSVPYLSRCRAYARNYPPAGTHLTLPVWNITTGLQSPLSDSALELAKMVRRSIARQTMRAHTGRSRWHDAAEKKQYEDFAYGRVHVNTHRGIGLWCQQNNNPEWKSRVEEVGAWMRQRLDPSFT